MSETLAPAGREPIVLGIVHDLVRELDAGRLTRSVSLDSLLDRDLGIGSLERVELLLRLEQASGVRLADHVMANAATVRDLLIAVDTASPMPAEPVEAPSAIEQGSGAAAPSSIGTMVEAFRWHVDRTPDRVQIVLREDDGAEYRLTYGDLWHSASAVASGLHARGVGRGDAVALLLRTERAFFASYYGTLLAGAVPVPLYPPFRADQIEEYARRQAAILQNAEARLLITFDRAERVAGLLRPLAPALQTVVTADQLAEGQSHDGRSLRGTSADALALIQYTSGSTGMPKGVALSHANLLANVRAFGQALGIGPDDVGVSWLPLYHDMGLIGAWLGSLYHGVPVVIMSPLAFLSRPSRWLRTIHQHGGTMTAAPNFAYDLCARKIPEEELAGLDLRSLRAALNGAEAVHAETIDRFTRRFSAHGFRAEAMCPVYGLAETSLCLTVPPMAEPPRVDRIAREPFQRARQIRPALADEPALTFVGCGAPVPTTDVRVVDDRGEELGERREGRIQFRGPSASAGYFRNPSATAELVDGHWLNTGDLGYWADRHLHITGRKKDVIIAAGRNIYPQEIEEAVGETPGIRRGCVAAFGCRDEQTGTERLVVVAESRERDPSRRSAMEADASRRIVDIVGVPPDAVVIVPPGAIPKTSSGKIRRTTTRDLYEQGQLVRGRASAALQWSRLIAANLAWRAGRAAGTIGAAVFTGYVWLVAGIGLLILVPLVAAAGGPRRGGAITRAWCRALFACCAMPVSHRGDLDAAATRPAVFVANHASYMDALLLRAALPSHVRFAAKDRLLDYPVLGGLLRGSDVIAVSRGTESAADRLTDVVRGGGAFAIFPEGTFMRPPGLLPFRLGAFRAAVDAGCPVFPVALVGTRRAWPDETTLIRRHRVEVVIGQPLVAEGTGWPEMVRLRDRAREFLARETGEAAFQPHTPDSAARASGRM